MMTVNELDRLYHEDTGITFSSMYPGCIAETALFREKRSWFRKVSVVVGGVLLISRGKEWRSDWAVFFFLCRFSLSL
jgi:hypothetical protein